MTSTDQNNAPTIDFPDLNETCLDPATLDQLFHDIAACTRLIEIIPKFAQRQYAPEHSIDLEHARRLIDQRQVRAIQLRYIYEGVQWWDTLMLESSGVRLVRIRHDFTATPVHTQ